ncbi:hypothetical protein [Nocardiopsis metallicus]|uniref:Fibronectin type-III domain-containing protein n=1 Tax=Nocardiopsis metallicus TaxID=179819 RepID=A0A840WDD6_9ACTN|nr:hypothetical protein [Nocardiopsis metallicus]MBB5495020.1 hypothetical protein [Nocardiopsis metallicus]
MNGFDIRLVALAPNGEELGPLPYPNSVEVGQPYNDLPSLRVDYSAHAPGASHLERPCEVAVQTYDPDTGEWTEGPDSRFLRVKRSGDLTDPTGARSYQMPGYGWQLRKLRLYPSATGTETEEGKRAFAGATVGTVLRTWINEGRSRGALPGLEADFDTQVDSAGREWDTALTLDYELGTDLLSVLEGMAEQGVCDWRFEGRTLRVFAPDTVMARDLASGPAPVDLRLGRDITEAPTDASLEDLVSHLFVAGDEGFRLEVDNPGAQMPWGRWEDYLTQGGVSDEGTARLLAGAALQRGARERVQITRGLMPRVARWLPWRDYRPGDLILAPDGEGHMASLRLRQITLSRDQDGAVTGNLVLNDRFLEAEIRRARRTTALTGGSVGNGGSGAQPAPEGPDTRRPVAPQGLAVHSDAYLDADGAAQGYAGLTWSPVDTATDGGAIDTGAYQVYGRRNVTGQVWRRLVSVDHPDTAIGLSPLPVGQEWAFKVRAVSSRNGLAGPFGPQEVVTLASDTEAPPVPSAPLLSTRLGVISAEWDGAGAGGEPMPADFRHARLWMRGDQGWEHRFDYQGPPREPWTVEHGTLAVTDEGLALNGSATLVRDLGGLDQTLELVARRVDEDRGTLWLAPRAGDAPERGSHYTPEVPVDLYEVPLGQSVVVRIQTQGTRVRAWLDGTLVHDAPLTWGQRFGTRFAVEGTGVVLREARVPATDTWEPIALLEGPTTITVAGQPYNTPRWFRLTAVDRSGNESDPSAEEVTRTEPLVDVDLHPGTVKAAHIQANAVTADKIDAGAVEAGHIRAGAVESRHITADAVNGKTITGAVVRSSAGPGPRWQADGNGIRFWNQNNQVTFNASTATGSVLATGRFQTASSGNRVWIDGNLRGRPRMELHTGDSSQAQPNVFAMGQQSDGFPTGSLVVSGREQTINSTGRADLVLEHGGDFKLVQNHGANSQVGIHKTGRTLRFRGALPSGMFGGTNTFMARGFNPQGESWTWWQWSWGTPIPSGRSAIPFVQLRSGNPEGMSVSVSGANSTGFRIEKRPSGAQHYYLWAVLKEGGHGE